MTIMRGTISKGQERAVMMDPIANALIVLPNNHSYIHKGQHFKCGVSDQLVNTNQKLSISVSTPGWVPTVGPDDTLYHMVWRTWANGPVSFCIYEDVTAISGGSVLTPFNNNRTKEITYTTDLTITGGALVRTGGTALHGLYYDGATSGPSGKSLTGFNNRDDDELLLKAASTYVFELVALSADDHYAGVEVAWYEYVPED